MSIVSGDGTPVSLDGTGTLNATLPAGIGLTSTGPQAPVAAAGVAAALNAATAGLSGDPAIATAINTYAASLPAGSGVIVRTITPNLTPGASSIGSGPILIQGTDGGTSEALVIDTRGLPAGTAIQLDGVDFATVIGNAQVIGGAGKNMLVSDSGDGNIQGGADTDTLFGGAGNDMAFGNAGNDILFGNAGADQMYGGRGDDILFGGRDNDLLSGDDGSDVVVGDLGDDTVIGGGDSDALSGGAGNDLLFGNAGQDLLFGNAGTDTLFGGGGNDTLFGGDGDDALFGDLGNDLLVSGAGNDTLTGGAGADVFIFSTGDGADRITDFNAADGDRIGLAPGQTYSVAANGAGEAVIVFSDTHTVTLAGVRREQFSTDWVIFG